MLRGRNGWARRAFALALVVPLALGLAACGAGKAAVNEGLTALRTDLEAIEGVEEAQVSGSYDGSPTRRILGVTVYVSDMSPDAVIPVVEEALNAAWQFGAFVPVGYSIGVWPAPRTAPPVDSGTMFDLELVRPDLGLSGGYVFDSELAVGPEALETKYGPRKE